MQSDDEAEAPNDIRPSPRPPEPDAHGQAALLLVESVLHVLIEAKALTLDQAIDAVRTASEVKVDLAAEMGESKDRLQQSLALLAGIGRSLEVQSRAAG